MLRVTCSAVCDEAGKLDLSGREEKGLLSKYQRKKPGAGGDSISEMLLEAAAAGAAPGHERVLPGSGWRKRAANPHTEPHCCPRVNEKDVSVLWMDLGGLPRRTKSLL